MPTPTRDFICRGPNCWGRGSNPRIAFRNAKKNLSSWAKPKPGDANFVVHDCPPGTQVTDMGGLRWTRPGAGSDPVYREPELVGYYDINMRMPERLA